MTNITRRTAIVGAAVSAAAVGVAALPAIIPTQGADAALLALAAELIAIRQTWDERAKGHEDDVAYDICNQPEEPLAHAIESQIAAMVPTTLKGFCVKLLIVTGFGDYHATDELVREAMDISGFLPEPSHPMHPDYVRPEPQPEPADSPAALHRTIAALSPDNKREFARRIRSEVPELAQLADAVEAWADRQTA